MSIEEVIKYNSNKELNVTKNIGSYGNNIADNSYYINDWAINMMMLLNDCHDNNKLKFIEELYYKEKNNKSRKLIK